MPASRCPASLPVPGCASREAGPVTHHLSATYYDTPGTPGWAGEQDHLAPPHGRDGRGLAPPSLPVQRRRPAGDPRTAGGRRRGDGSPSASPLTWLRVAGDLPLAPIAILSHGNEPSRLSLASAGEVIAEVADDEVTARREGAPGAPLRWARGSRLRCRGSHRPSSREAGAAACWPPAPAPAAKGSKLGAACLDSPGKVNASPPDNRAVGWL